MNQEKPSQLYTSMNISKSFKIFLMFFIVLALSMLGWVLYKTGEKLDFIIPLIAGETGGIFLIYWIVTKGIRKINGLDGLSDIEKFYVEDIGKLRLTAYIKKYIFSDLDIQGVIRFIVVFGYLFKWMFFWIFSGGTIIVLLHKDTVLNITLISMLAIIWCPWIEGALSRKLDYKIIFIGRILLTFMLFSIGIYVSP